MGDAPARRSRRRGDQDRGSERRRRRRPLRAAVPARHRLPLLRDVQPEQGERDARSAQPRRARGVRGPRPPLGCRLLEPARRPARQARAALRGPRARQPADRLRLAVRLRDDRLAGGRGRLRHDDPGPERVDGGHRRPGRPADEERALAGRLRRGYVAAIGLLSGVWQARRDGVGRDVDVSLFETALSLLTYIGTWTASPGLAGAADAGLGASDDHPLSGVSGGRRLARRRVREDTTLAALLRRDRAAELAADERFAASASATGIATRCSRSCARRSPGAPLPSGSSG